MAKDCLDLATPSYKLTVLLPKKQENSCWVTMPDAYTAYRLLVNGKQVAANGKVSTTTEGFIPHWQYQAFDVDHNTDTLHLILQVANFVHNKGGIKKPIFIGEKTEMELGKAAIRGN